MGRINRLAVQPFVIVLHEGVRHSEIKYWDTNDLILANYFLTIANLPPPTSATTLFNSASTFFSNFERTVLVSRV